MQFKVHLGSVTLFGGDIDAIPPIGTWMRCTIETYCKGYFPGTIIDFEIKADQPPQLDYTTTPPIMYLDCNGFSVIHEAPTPLGEER